MNAIYILWLRQIKRYLRSKPRMIGSLGQPLLFLIAFGYGIGPMVASAGRGNYLQFIAPGVVSMSVLFTSVFSGIETIWDRQFGFLKETLVAPVTRLNIMIGRTMGGATVAVVQGIIVLLLSILVGFRPVVTNFPLSLFIMFLIAMAFTSLGTAIASVLTDMQGFQLIMNFLVMPLFFLSGAIFPLDGLGKGLSAVTRFNPLSYGVDGLRATLIGVHHFGIFQDVLVLSLVTIVLLLVGGYLFNKIEV